MSYEKYIPEYPPSDPERLSEYLYREFQRISILLDMLVDGHLDEVFVAPTKPREGDIRFADGSNWNPGKGRGIYVFINGKWNCISDPINPSPTTGLVEITSSAPTVS